MRKDELIHSLRCGMFASRESIDEAYEYALDMLGRNPGTLTALHVLMNTIANEVEMQDWVESYEMPRVLHHIDYQEEKNNG